MDDNCLQTPTFTAPSIYTRYAENVNLAIPRNGIFKLFRRYYVQTNSCGLFCLQKLLFLNIIDFREIWHMAAFKHFPIRHLYKENCFQTGIILFSKTTYNFFLTK